MNVLISPINVSRDVADLLQRCSNSGIFRTEVMMEVGCSKKVLKSFGILGSRPLNNGSNFGWIHVDSFSTDNASKQANFFVEELAFLDVDS